MKEKAHSLLLRCLQSNSAIPFPHPLCLTTYYIYFSFFLFKLRKQRRILYK